MKPLALLRPGTGLRRLPRTRLRRQLDAARTESEHLRTRLARADRAADDLTCALVRVTHQLDVAGIELSGARLDIEALRAQVQMLDERAQRRDAEIRRLTAALERCRPAPATGTGAGPAPA
ncbi:hypothetical protein ADL21_11315 [Streptomyces albus subsp. albus]|nr:hypothetical protein ADL21_11315 [Streptomyces albus subsp. albus]